MHISPFFLKVLDKIGLLSSLNLESTIKVNGAKVDVPILARQGFGNLYLTEPWMTEVLKKLRPYFKGHFIDVGVNIGQTLIKAYSVFGKVEYLGIEPNPSCVHYVQELVKINKLEGVQLLPLGVGARTEVLKLHFFASDNSDSAASIIDEFRPGSHEDHFIYVPIFDFQAIQKFMPSTSSCILKIDVEGAELDVLLGLENWITEYEPLILLEVLPAYNLENHRRIERQSRIEELLNSLNYKIARIIKAGKVRLDPIDAFGIHSSLEDCDYILYPSKIASEILGYFADSESKRASAL